MHLVSTEAAALAEKGAFPHRLKRSIEYIIVPIKKNDDRVRLTREEGVSLRLRLWESTCGPRDVFRISAAFSIMSDVLQQ